MNKVTNNVNIIYVLMIAIVNDLMMKMC